MRLPSFCPRKVEGREKIELQLFQNGGVGDRAGLRWRASDRDEQVTYLCNPRDAGNQR